MKELFEKMWNMTHHDRIGSRRERNVKTSSSFCRSCPSSCQEAFSYESRIPADRNREIFEDGSLVVMSFQWLIHRMSWRAEAVSNSPSKMSISSSGLLMPGNWSSSRSFSSRRWWKEIWFFQGNNDEDFHNMARASAVSRNSHLPCTNSFRDFFHSPSLNRSILELPTWKTLSAYDFEIPFYFAFCRILSKTPREKKFVLYSGHDYTIMALMCQVLFILFDLKGNV